MYYGTEAMYEEDRVMPTINRTDNTNEFSTSS